MNRGAHTKRLLFVKPPDRFLENEFVFQQLGPHYLQSFLEQHGIDSDLLILYETVSRREERLGTEGYKPSLHDLRMLLLSGGSGIDLSFDIDVFGNYDVVGMSVMTPQAPDAYLLNEQLKSNFPKTISVIGGSHARYYQSQVESLPESHSFDFIVPQDGWEPILEIMTGKVEALKKSTVLVSNLPKLGSLPPPTRPVQLMERYNFLIAGAPAFHTISALGCPFTCHFCESGIERVRLFGQDAISEDLRTIKSANEQLNHDSSA